MTFIPAVLTLMGFAFCGCILYGLFGMLTPKDWAMGRDILFKIGAFCALILFLVIFVTSFILLGALWGLIASMGELFVGILLISVAIQIAFW